MNEIPGLVWGYRFDPATGRATVLPADAGRDVVGRDDGILWLHLALSDARIPGFLAGIADLPEAARQTLTERDTHVKLTVTDGVVHGVLTDLEREFDYETRDIGWFRFAFSDRLIITARLHPLRCIETARHAVENGRAHSHPVHIFESIVLEFQKTLVRLVVEMTDELDTIEDHVFDDVPRDERRRLGPVRRTIVRLHRQLRATIQLMRRLEIEDREDVPPGMAETAERLADKLGAVYSDMQALQDRARLLHEEIDSKISSETNRHLYVLSVMTALLLPPTLVVGFFGMNTSDMPFTLAVGGTWYAFSVCAASILGAWWLLRRNGIF
nr:transporter [Chthonobacter rhizosphaerae]